MPDPNSLVAAYPTLMHYTTCEGLNGIIGSGAVRATRMDHLNDLEEYVGFHKRRLPVVLKEATLAAIRDAQSTATGRARLEAMGGQELASKKIAEELHSLLGSKLDTFGVPYVACFCAPPPNRPEDGLLSQWRAYGSDGGYAIVFDTAGLDELMRREVAKHWYLYAHAGDVEYYDEHQGRASAYPETLAAEAEIRNGIHKFLLSGAPEDLEVLPSPIEKLSCLHKHCGFREEREVRFFGAVGVRQLDSLRDHGDVRGYKPIEFRSRNGIPVPYISLFRAEPQEKRTKLPIVKVIVGPHVDRARRKKAVEDLLTTHGVDASVVASDIPFAARQE